MTRAEKVKLLKDLRDGKIKLDEFKEKAGGLPKQWQVHMFFPTDNGMLRDEKGNLYTEGEVAAMYMGAIWDITLNLNAGNEAPE